MDTNTFYEKTFKQFIFGFVGILSLYFIFINIYFTLTFPVRTVAIIATFFNPLVLVLIFILPVMYIRKLLWVYISIMCFLLYVVGSWLLANKIQNILLWFIVLPVFISVAEFGKKPVRILLFCLCLATLTLLSAFTIDNYFATGGLITDDQTLIFGIINTLVIILLLSLSLYYGYRFIQIQTSPPVDAKADVNGNKKEVFALGNDHTENYKYEEIYQQIREYMENNKPYLDADFKISKMAYDLNINNTYITSAIRKVKNMSFVYLINTYRVETVKKLIKDNIASKYTLEYIYLSSGFESQSSFNRVFKQHTGITPSDYFKQVNTVARDYKSQTTGDKS